jgi:hypothetical protein
MTDRLTATCAIALVMLIAGRTSAAAGQAPGTTGDAGQPAAPKVVEEGVFPKSIKIPGTDLSFVIGGYVKVDFIQDFDAIGNAFDFQTNSIAVDGSAAAAQSGRTTIHARETRLNFDLRSEGTGGRHFRVFAEGDFYGDGNAFRMRHAFGEFGGLLGGQTWSTFQDISARPLTVDFEGPDGEVFVRQTMIRLTRRFAEHWTVAVAAENPTGQFAIPSGLAGSARSLMPDIPGFVRYQRGPGHVQVAGLVRQLRFDSTGSTPDASSTGWGVNTTFVLPGGGRNQLLGMFVIGEGVARYIESLAGQNLDAILTGNSLATIRSQAGTIGYNVFWTPTLKSGFAYSTASVEGAAGLGDATIDRVQDVRINLFYTPYRLVDVAGEVLWGRRENKNGASGDAWRVQFAVIYRLN